MTGESANKREQEQILQMNMLRVMVACIFMFILVPLIMLRLFLLNDYTAYLKMEIIGYTIYELLCLFFGACNYVLVYISEKKSYSLIQLEIIILILGLFTLGGFDFYLFNNFASIYLSVLFYIFVPILDYKERLRISLGMVIIDIFVFIVNGMHFEKSIDILIILVLTIIIAKYQHTFTYRFKTITGQLKKRTITSEHDALTGLLNRRALESRIAFIWPQCVERSIPVGLIELDIDYFKKYNDTYGHPKGDACLKNISEVLKESLKGTNAIITRTGGEEFLILLQDCDRRYIIEMSLKIKKNVEKLKIKHSFYADSDYVTVSVGAAYGLPSSELVFQKLYEEADKSLYKAKQNGRNCFVFEGRIFGKKDDFVQFIGYK